MVNSSLDATLQNSSNRLETKQVCALSKETLEKRLRTIGELNSKLLKMHYGDVPVLPNDVRVLVVESRQLLHRAGRDYELSLFCKSEAEESLQVHSDIQRQASVRSSSSSSTCVGPCVHVGADVASRLRSAPLSERASIVTSLPASALQPTVWTVSNPTLCSVGVNCASVYPDAVSLSSSQSWVHATRDLSDMALKILKEAKHTNEFAEQVLASVVHEVQAGPVRDRKLKGGATGESQVSVTQANRLLQYYNLPPIEIEPGVAFVSLQQVVDASTRSLAPRIQDRVRTKLMYKLSRHIEDVETKTN